MYIGRFLGPLVQSILDYYHPISIFILMNWDDEDLIIGFHELLDEIQYRQDTHKQVGRTIDLMDTAQNIMELVFRDHGGWAFLRLGQGHQYFLQQLQEQRLLDLPQQNFIINQPPQQNITISQQPQQAIEYRQQTATPTMGQARSPDIIERQQRALSGNEQQVLSNQDKHDSFLERLNKNNEHDEKMKNRYADELALKARTELEAEEKKAIEIEKENARKLKEAEERLKKTRIENERKEHVLARTDEAISRADELERQVREMTEKAEQEKRDSERRIDDRRREATAKRDQDRQRWLNDSRSRTDGGDRNRFNYENNQMYRSSADRTVARGHGEHELREGKETKKDNWRFHGDNMREDDYRQRMLLDNVGTQGSSPTPPKHIVPGSDDDDSDSDEGKRQDPYKLIGLPDRERTPIKDIETTQRVLNSIHQTAIKDAISEATIKYAEKRLVEIKWAADILLDEMNKRAYDEDGAIYPHEQQIWKKKKNGIGGGGGGKYIPG